MSTTTLTLAPVYPIGALSDDYGLPGPRLTALTMARIAALESVIGAWSALNYHGPTSIKPDKPKGRKPRVARVTKPTTMTGEEFFDARMVACRAVAADVGPNWHLIEGASHWCAIPSKLRSFVYRSARGSVKIKCHADARMPAGRYWPTGTLPEGVIEAPDLPRDRTPAAMVLRIEATRRVKSRCSDYQDMRRRAALAQTDRGAWGNDDDTRHAKIQAAWDLRRELREAERALADLGTSADVGDTQPHGEGKGDAMLRSLYEAKIQFEDERRESRDFAAAYKLLDEQAAKRIEHSVNVAQDVCNEADDMDMEPIDPSPATRGEYFDAWRNINDNEPTPMAA